MPDPSSVLERDALRTQAVAPSSRHKPASGIVNRGLSEPSELQTTANTTSFPSERFVKPALS